MGYSPEYAALEGDPAYLARLAELGGGAVLAEPAGALVHDLKGAGVRRDLWPWLLGLAALLLPIDVGVRRLALGRRDMQRAWAWVVARLPRRRLRPVAEVPSPVGRLFEAKSRAGERRPGGQVSVSDAAPAEPEVEAPPAPARPQQVPSPVSRGRAEPGAGGAAEGQTLAERLLRRKRERRE
jgi:hypothetical protein